MELSDEAQYIIELLRKGYKEGCIKGNGDIIVGREAFAEAVGDEAFEEALYELEGEGYITGIKSFIDGAFAFELRLKGKKAISCPNESQKEQTVVAESNHAESGNAATQYSAKELVVMAEYPQFGKDYQTLLDNGYIAKSGGGLKWLKSKTSLAEYFASLSQKRNNWHIIENLFGENGLSNIYKNITAKSKDYKTLEQILHKG